MSELETSHEGRAIESKQYQEAQKKKRTVKPKKVWYEQVKNKIVKKIQSANNTVYSTYVGRFTKDLWAKVKDKSN